MLDVSKLLFSMCGTMKIFLLPTLSSLTDGLIEYLPAARLQLWRPKHDTLDKVIGLDNNADYLRSVVVD